jgi:hypothetical protein|nr:hypothetical protein [uncultured Acetatifactor sp.]
MENGRFSFNFWKTAPKCGIFLLEQPSSKAFAAFAVGYCIQKDKGAFLMNERRNSNWKRILTGWLSAFLLFGTINGRPGMPPANAAGAAVQVTEGQEGQEGLEGEPEAHVCCELEEERTQRD